METASKSWFFGWNDMCRIGVSRGVAVLALSCVVFAGACQAPDTEIEQMRERAADTYAVGNHVDSAIRYGELAGREADGSPEADRARLRKAISLYRLGRFDEANAALDVVDPDPEDQAGRQLASLFRARCLVGLAREASPALLVPDATNEDEIKRRSRLAEKLYEAASHYYRRVLADDPEHFDANLERADCRFRLGLLYGNRDLIGDAEEHLAVCRAQDPDDFRVLFLRGRIEQEQLGEPMTDPETFQAFRGLTESAATSMREALQRDRDWNFDYHLGYRDVYLYLRHFPRVSDIKLSALEGEARPQQRKRELAIEHRRKWVRRFADMLAEYVRAGRVPSTAWGQELIAEIESYLLVYEADLGRRSRAMVGIDRAEEAFHQFLDHSDFEVAERAIGLLHGLPESDWDRTDYIRVRSAVQAAYVEALEQRAQRLADVGDWPGATQCCARAGELLDERWIRDAEVIDLRARFAEIRHGIAWGRTMDIELTGVLEMIEQGRLSDAEIALQLAATKVPSDDQQTLAKIDGLRAAVEESGRPELSSTVIQARGAALELESEGDMAGAIDALDAACVDSEGIPYLHEQMVRNLARVHYQQQDFQSCLETLSYFRTNPEAANSQDKLLLGKCCFHQGDAEAAKRFFDEVGFIPTMDDEALLLAGLANLAEGHVESARVLLENYRTRVSPQEVDERADPALADCARRLYERWQSGSVEERRRDRDVGIELVSLILELEKDDYRAHRALGVLLYDRALDGHHAADHERAYQHLLLASRHGFVVDDPEHRQALGRLAACFGDLMPLEVGRRWTYTGQATQGGPDRITIEITGYDEARSGFVVQRTEIGHDGAVSSSSGEEIWRRMDVSRVERCGEGFRWELPIPLRVPETLPRTIYEVRGATYESVVTSTGETIERSYGRSYENCVTVRVQRLDEESRAPTGPYDEFRMAPGVGLVEFRVQGRRFVLRSSETGVTVPSVPSDDA